MSETKAYLELERGDDLRCMFNPAELSISKSNRWEAVESKGTNAPTLRFQQGDAGSLKVSLTFDTTAEGGPVTQYTDRLLQLMAVDDQLPGSDRGRNKSRPPWVRLHWADLHSFKAVVDSLTLTFTYFASDGTPLRAKAQLGLKQYEDDGVLGLQNPTSGTPVPHRVHRVVHGETLDRIAARHLGDPGRWRLLARANDILDPLVLEEGTSLIIPELQPVRRAELPALEARS